jgi:membrane protein
LIRFITDLAWNSGKEFFKDACPQLSAAITYYFVFSIFPFTIFAASIVGLVLSEEAQDDLIDEILEWIPLSQDQGRADLEQAIDALSTSEAQVAGLIGLVVLLWSASSMFNSVRRALNIIFGEDEYRRPWVPQKLIDLGLVLGLGLFFVASAFAGTLISFARNSSDDWRYPGDADGSALWTLAEYGVAATIAFAGFTILYLIVPSRPRRLADVWPGALIAAIAFQVAVVSFGWWIRTFSDMSAIYGSLTAVMVFLLWVFLGAQIMLAGAEVASVYPRVRAGEFRQEGMEGIGPPLTQQVRDLVVGLFVRRE